jgi:hypothetical protein
MLEVIGRPNAASLSVAVGSAEDVKGRLMDPSRRGYCEVIFTPRLARLRSTIRPGGGFSYR